jgi:hypothetical protein
VILSEGLWALLEEVKVSKLTVEARIDLLMEDEGNVIPLDNATGRAQFDMTNASLIKSPRDAFSNVEPVVWASERTNAATGAIDHLVVIAFELWNTIAGDSRFLLDINVDFALDGQRFASFTPSVHGTVDAADYTFRATNNPLFNPKTDPATGLPVVDVSRLIVVRSLLVPEPTWKLVEAALANGPVTTAVSIGLVMKSAAGSTTIDQTLITGLAEPRPDPVWLLQLLNLN